jgi:hypothetical protein
MHSHALYRAAILHEVTNEQTKILDTVWRYIGLISIHELQAARCCWSTIQLFVVQKFFYFDFAYPWAQVTIHRKCQVNLSSIQVQRVE